jgi:hypothetical protein
MGLSDQVSLTGQGQELNKMMMMDVPDASLLCPWRFSLSLAISHDAKREMSPLKDPRSERTEAVFLIYPSI